MKKDKLNLLLSKDGFVNISFTGTDATLTVYEEDGVFKVVYMALPDADRTPDMSDKDIRFTIENTNVKEYLMNRGESQ
jgi:hypothetical protein